MLSYYIKKFFTPYPKSPNEFVQNFLFESKYKRVQLELIYKNNILIQVDSLKFTPSWFKLVNLNSIEYSDGYVIFFLLDADGIKSNPVYEKISKSNIKMIEIKEKHDKTDIITFSRFIKNTYAQKNLPKYMKEIIDSAYDFKEMNPQIKFNLRFIEING